MKCPQKKCCGAFHIYEAATSLSPRPPGNVRELANLLERAYALDERDFGSLLDGYRSATGETGALQNTLRPDQSERLADMTRLHVRQVLEKHGGNVSHAAAALGVSRNTVLKYAR